MTHMPAPPPPEHVRQFILALRAASRFDRKARIAWYAARDTFKTGIIPADLGSLTCAMWSADLHLESMAASWRSVLAERLALPPAERWDLAALQRWAADQDKDGAP